MIRDDVKIIVTPTGVSLEEVLTKEVVKALNEEASIYMNYEIPEVKIGGEDNYYGWKDTFTEISLCSGSIKKLIGRELSWSDEPVELK